MSDAWGLTMIEFWSLYDAKFGHVINKIEPFSEEELNEFDKIENIIQGLD